MYVVIQTVLSLPCSTRLLIVIDWIRAAIDSTRCLLYNGCALALFQQSRGVPKQDALQRQVSHLTSSAIPAVTDEALDDVV